MTIIKTKDLTGAHLDWAVAQCEGVAVGICLGGYLATLRQIELTPYSCTGYEPSKNWAQGGPIIEREMMGIMPVSDAMWRAGDVDGANGYGATPLIAAMRCFVAANIGEIVDIPEHFA